MQPVPIPKPPSFWAKLLGLFLITFLGALTGAMPQIAAGNYSGLVAAFGLATVTAVAYSLDPNHASASQDQIKQALLGTLHAAEVLPAARVALGRPVVGEVLRSAVDTFADRLADELARKVAGGDMTVADAKAALDQAIVQREVAAPVVSVLTPEQQAVLDHFVDKVAAPSREVA